MQNRSCSVFAKVEREGSRLSGQCATATLNSKFLSQTLPPLAHSPKSDDPARCASNVLGIVPWLHEDVFVFPVEVTSDVLLILKKDIAGAEAAAIGACKDTPSAVRQRAALHRESAASLSYHAQAHGDVGTLFNVRVHRAVAECGNCIFVNHHCTANGGGDVEVLGDQADIDEAGSELEDLCGHLCGHLNSWRHLVITLSKDMVVAHIAGPYATTDLVLVAQYKFTVVRRVDFEVLEHDCCLNHDGTRIQSD
eukprot:348545-Prymnesium_polylepis.2